MKLPSRIVELIRELRRRRVLQAAAVYATGAFVAVQVAANVFPALQLPDWSQSLVVILAIAGFPVVVAVWWAYEITPEGIRRTVEQDEAAEVLHPRGTPWTALALVGVVTVASAGLGWAAWDLWLDPGQQEQRDAEQRTGEELSLPPTRVAVLPFEAGSGEERIQEIAEALRRDLSHHLNQVDALDVVSDRGVRGYAASDVPVDSVTRALGAGSLVTGTVEGVGDRILLRVQLVEGRSGESLMSRQFSEPRDSVMALRDVLVDEAVRQLRRRLGEEIEVERTRTSTEDREAWELYHRAETLVQDADSLRYAGARELAEGLYAKADSLYRASHGRDADWLAPRLARGWVSYKRARLGGAAIDSTDPEQLRAGVEIADGILEDRPGSAPALELRGVLRSWLCKVRAVDSLAWRQAERDLRAAVTEDPNRARAWVELADVLRAQGEFAEARTAWRQARQADAFLSNDGDVLRLGAHLALDLGDTETALEWARKGQRRYPRSAATYLQFPLLVYAMDGAPRVSPDSVWGALRELEEVMGVRLPYARVWVAAALARLGLEDSARSVLERAREGQEGNGRYVAYYEPKVWLNLGDTARALRLLREAVEVHGWKRRYVAEDSWWVPLHGDSAFQALVEGAE